MRTRDVSRRARILLGVALAGALLLLVAYAVYNHPRYRVRRLLAVARVRYRVLFRDGDLTRAPPLPKDTAELLLRHRELMIEEALRLGESPRDADRALAVCVLLDFPGVRRGVPIMVDYLVRGQEEKVWQQLWKLAVRARSPGPYRDSVVDELVRGLYRSRGSRTYRFRTMLPRFLIQSKELQRALSSPEDQVRLGAAIAAGLFKYEGREELVGRLLRSASASVKGCVSLGLGMDDREVRSNVEHLLQSNDAHLRAWAKLKLGGKL